MVQIVLTQSLGWIEHGIYILLTAVTVTSAYKNDYTKYEIDKKFPLTKYERAKENCLHCKKNKIIL